MTYDTSDALWICRLLWIVNLAYEVNCNMKHTPNWLLEEITIRCSFYKLHCWHGKDGKNVKSDCLIVWQQSHNQLGYLLISYHYSASLVHGPQVNPLQYHIIGSGAGGGQGGRGGYSSSERKWEGSSAPPPSPHRSLCMFQSALICHLRTCNLRCHHHLFNK